MTRRGHKRAAPGEHFVLVPDWILVSDRWHALSVDARAIAIDICMRWNGESKPKFRIINNNGSIHYGCREAAHDRGRLRYGPHWAMLIFGLGL